MLHGIPVSPGVAIAPAFVRRSQAAPPPHRSIPTEGIPAELGRVGEAFAAARRDLDEAAARAGLADAVGSIAASHRGFLADPTLLQEIEESIVRGRAAAEWAVSVVFRRWVEKFKALKDEFFRQRYVDLVDIERRVLGHLLPPEAPRSPSPERPMVLLAHEITPSEAAALDRQSVLGFATELGGSTSHTAIVAKSLGIPAVCGLGPVLDGIPDGAVVVCDGESGRLVVDPDPKSLRSYSELKERLQRRARYLRRVADLPAETPDGWPVGVLVNVEFPSEVAAALRNGADGIGLYRTEFLCAETGSVPDEEAHLRAYRDALEHLRGRSLTIRTFDFGADKFGEEAGIGREPNPFLGCRSIRFSLARPDLFRTQLRAILRASAEGPVSLLLPMISSLTELRSAFAILEETKESLRRERIPFDTDLPVGVMVEIPSAAIAADLLAREVDFFSIGTNDLTQYTLAVDRTNERVASLFRPANPAILRLLRTVVEVSERKRLRVTMCGEMASEKPYALFLLGLGIRQFSVAPGAVPFVKRVIRGVTRRAAEEIARRALGLSTPEEVDEYLFGEAERLLPES